MSPQLLSAAREQAEHSDPAVLAAALMHIARVLASSDRATAAELLDRGIGIAKKLESFAASLMLRNAVYLAAAVLPNRAIQLYADSRREDPFGGEVIGLVNAMAEHGHLEDAIDYLNSPLPRDRFPLHFINNLARDCRRDETLLRLLRLASREWEHRDPDSREPGEEFAGQAFSGFFGRYWKLLPAEEARPLLRDLVRWALELRTDARSYPLTNDPNDPDLGSENECLLFGLLPALQSLDPNSARGVLDKHPQLAAAAKRFPMGMQSVWEEQPGFDRARDDAMMIGHSEVMYMSEALATDFSAPFQEAHNRYARDSDAEDPNKAPKECWPSAWEYRNILFKAGQHLGLAASKFLDRIPDPDLRLFAQIELCAAVEGLPQIAGCTVRHSSKSEPGICSPAEWDELLGSTLAGVRCPKCGWAPRAKNVWSCNCGHCWNTFDTRGLCPQCQHQWEVTECLQCGERSPHEKWYARP
jgi:hypothetical protein